ncbi:HNH endonuclease signature motif containing protein [Nocardioides sp. GY 10127]|uniref:HNH endonuclease signature motif containing protein n=1 Tax=Nocardioides sp. GY 10127 TaxID=2569762 RepID=UPI0014589067|nr:HNH endonuclease signature motif containing protein [Nocardioides sp. GY 10127]
MKRRGDDECGGPGGWAVPGEPVPHPLLRALAEVDVTVGRALGVSSAGLGEVEAGEALLGVTALEARVAALRSVVTARAEAVGVGSASGAPSAAAWLANRSGVSGAQARRRSRLARAVEGFSRLAGVFARGLVTEAQVEVVVVALADLPAGLEGWVYAAAEELMVEAAVDTSALRGGQMALDPVRLKRLGSELLTRVAPEVGEAREAKVLADQERVAWENADLRLRHDGQGFTWGTFRIPVAQGEQLERVLQALASPEHHRTTGRAGGIEPGAGEGSGEGGGEASGEAGRGRGWWVRPYRLRLGQAFAEWIDRFPAERLPSSGGVAARVVVTMTLADLVGTARSVTLDTGTRVSAGQARRWVCEAGLVPAVLGGKGEVLDLGRAQRFHTPAQRLALGLRDRGCTVEGCGAPPAYCHAHHETPWSQGGATSVEGARLLCPHHHRRVHDPGYRVEPASAGRIRLHRRT